jgi:hypothetical protein
MLIVNCWPDFIFVDGEMAVNSGANCYESIFLKTEVPSSLITAGTVLWNVRRHSLWTFTISEEPAKSIFKAEK